MAVSPVPKRYTSAVYEDKYFPDKNATIPFKWEATPGRPKFDDEEEDYGDYTHPLNMHAHAAQEDNTLNHQQNQELGMPLSKPNKDDELSPSTTLSPKVDDGVSIPHAVSIYPLPPPPKLTPASPLRVKDLLHHGQSHDFRNHDQLFPHCPRHTYPHGFPWFSFWFRPLKASTVVPIHKSTYRTINPQPKLADSVIDTCQASPLARTSEHGVSLQGRSQSFNYAQWNGGLGPMSTSAGQVSKPAPERRCNSFNSLSAPHHTILEQDEDYENESSLATAAAAAMWAGACILAAAAADNHDPCKVASKLRDLMQQSANFSELGLPTALAVCGHGTLPSTKKRTKSVEEEAFLKEGTRKSCTDDECDDEGHTLTKDKTNLAADGFKFTPSHHKLAKRKGYFTAFKNECIACWCPSSTH